MTTILRTKGWRCLLLVALAALLCAMVMCVPVQSAQASESKTLAYNASNVSKVGVQAGYSSTYGRWSWSCCCFSIAYAQTITSGKTKHWYEYNYYKTKNQYTCSASWPGNFSHKHYGTKLKCLQATYDAIKANHPVVLYVKNINKSRTQEHYVCAVGYKNVTSRSKLTTSNFIILDPASRKVRTTSLNSYDFKGGNNVHVSSSVTSKHKTCSYSKVVSYSKSSSTQHNVVKKCSCGATKTYKQAHSFGAWKKLTDRAHTRTCSKSGCGYVSKVAHTFNSKGVCTGCGSKEVPHTSNRWYLADSAADIMSARVNTTANPRKKIGTVPAGETVYIEDIADNGTLNNWVGKVTYNGVTGYVWLNNFEVGEEPVIDEYDGQSYKVVSASIVTRAMGTDSAKTNVCTEALGTNTSVWTFHYSSADSAYTIVHKATGKLLTAEGTAAKSNVGLAAENGSDEQLWKVTGTGSLHSLVSVASGLKVDLDSHNSTVGANLQVFTVNGAAAQQWHFLPASAGGGTAPTGSSVSVSSSVVQGSNCKVSGTVNGNGSKILLVSAGIHVGSTGATCKAYSMLTPNADSYNLANITSSLSTASLASGTYYYRISALTEGGAVLLVNKAFTVYAKPYASGCNYPTSLSYKSVYSIKGYVKSETNITSVTVGVYTGSNATGTCKTGKTVSCSTKSYDVHNVDANILFNKLAKGTYYYCIKAKNSAGTFVVLNKMFTVK